MTAKLKTLDVSVQNLEVMQYVGLQENSSKNYAKQYLGPTTHASLMHQQHGFYALQSWCIARLWHDFRLSVSLSVGLLSRMYCG